MKILNILLPILVVTLTSCKNDSTKHTLTASSHQTEQKETVKVIPINHGTLILESKNDILYIDPTGGKEAFDGQQTPTYILITDIHGDHLDIKTLTALPLDNTTIIAPKAVIDKLPKYLGKTQITLNNGSSFTPKNITIEAVPMYNLRAEALKFHTKGRGNGYIITVDGERIYISGDTEDIPEMRQLENIDKAFVCMNLPYTMTVKSAASAVLEFKPKQVYPYHYRGTDGFSDVVNFKSIVNTKDNAIEVLLLDWY
ncbi:MBL fold metallo-hydrolase [uncultured Winogradskyella sp.]|uniref:MBL fold metallo-hydrolase n=1 Tax=uncultured Winogradskyella sp. TaxID=395353 RepID=UPI0030DA31EB|tara:strand:- start:30546 stop:31313 length:768 start_codon:yes stop_codon:yes gene_type:complete